jgi:hypothetical protein
MLGWVFGFGGLEAIFARQVDREDYCTTKARVPSSKEAQKRKLAALVAAPSTPTLITPPGNRTRITSPLGKDLQGPSLVDYELELEAKKLLKMVLEMQEALYAKLARWSSEEPLAAEQQSRPSMIASSSICQLPLS